MLSAIALSRKQNAARVSFPYRPLTKHRKTNPPSESPHGDNLIVYLVTWANPWAPSWALHSFLSPSLPISPVPRSLCPVPSCSTSRSGPQLRPPHPLFFPVWTFVLPWPPDLQSPPLPAHLPCLERGLTVPELALLRTCSEPRRLPSPLTKSQPLSSSVALMTSPIP